MRPDAFPDALAERVDSLEIVMPNALEQTDQLIHLFAGAYEFPVCGRRNTKSIRDREARLRHLTQAGPFSPDLR
jgi:hypothetical protein